MASLSLQTTLSLDALTNKRHIVLSFLKTFKFNLIIFLI